MSLSRWLAPLAAVLCLSGAAEAKDLRDVMYAMRTPGVSTTVSWEDCGQVNAFYIISKRHVVLCNELKILPEPVIRYVLAHELAHGIIHQRDIPYTVSGEAAADELAGVMLLLYGDEEAVHSASLFWWTQGENNPPWDDHPDDDERGWRLGELWAGYHGRTEELWWYFRRATAAWFRLLGYDKP